MRDGLNGAGVSRFPDRPPLKLFGHQAEFQGGVFAAMAALAALHYRSQTGAGQAIEVSEQECLATMLEGALVRVSYAGQHPSRLGKHAYAPRSRGPRGTAGSSSTLGEDDQWQRLVELMGNPEWAREEIFKDRFTARRVCRSAVADDLSPGPANWKKQDLFMAAQAKRIPVAPMNRPSDVYADAQLRARNFFASVTHARWPRDRSTRPFLSNPPAVHGGLSGPRRAWANTTTKSFPASATHRPAPMDRPVSGAWATA